MEVRSDEGIRSPNVMSLDAMYEAFNAGDIEATLEHWHEDCEWRPAFGARLLGENLYMGHAGFRKYVAEVSEALAGYQTIALGYDEFGDHVICRVESTGKGRGSGITISQRFFIHYTLRDGKIARGQTYSDLGEAMSAVSKFLAESRSGDA